MNTDGLSVTMWDRQGSQYVGRLKSLGDEETVPLKRGFLVTLVLHQNSVLIIAFVFIIRKCIFYYNYREHKNNLFSVIAGATVTFIKP